MGNTTPEENVFLRSAEPSEDGFFYTVNFFHRILNFNGYLMSDNFGFFNVASNEAGQQLIGELFDGYDSYKSFTRFSHVPGTHETIKRSDVYPFEWSLDLWVEKLSPEKYLSQVKGLERREWLNKGTQMKGEYISLQPGENGFQPSQLRHHIQRYFNSQLLTDSNNEPND